MARPKWYGNAAVANRIKYGDCKFCVAVADSINGMTQNDLSQAIMRTWRVAKFVGMTTPPANGSSVGIGSINPYGNAGQFSADIRPCDRGIVGGRNSAGALGIGGISAYSATDTAEMAFVAGSYGAASALSNRLIIHYTSDTVAAGNFVSPIEGGNGAGFNWLKGATPTFKGFYLQNANGANNLYLDARWGSTNVQDAASTTFTLNGTQQIVAKSITYTNANGSAGVPTPGFDYPNLSVLLRGVDLATPVAGSNIIFLNGLVTTGQIGFQFDNLAQGSTGLVNYWNTQADGNVYSGILNAGTSNWQRYIGSSAWQKYHQLMGTNVFMIWIGQNDVGYVGLGTINKAMWKARVLGIMNECKLANPAAQFLLVSSYDTSVNTGTSSVYYQQLADALYEIALQDGSALFVDLLNMLGNPGLLNQGYLNSWVTGLNYYTGDYVLDLVAGHYYVAKGAGSFPFSSATRPALDAANWTLAPADATDPNLSITNADRNFLLGDGVHMNKFGRVRAAAVVWEAIESAATQYNSSTTQSTLSWPLNSPIR